MEKTLHVDFVLESKLQGMHFNPHRPEGLEFKPDGDNGVRFILKPASSDDACGFSGGLECKVYATYKVTEAQFDFIDAYSKHKKVLRVADEFTIPYKRNNDTLIAADGSCKNGFSPRRYLCPQDISELIVSVESDLTTKIDRFLKLLRWRQGVAAPGEVVQSSALYWRVDSGDYPSVPLDGDPPKKITLKGGLVGIVWDTEDAGFFKNLWLQSNLDEPLGHALLREAATVAKESPRSAIMIMTAALESAVKIHISKRVPNTSWLMEEVSSPPIFKIINQYLPLIHPEIDCFDELKTYVTGVQRLFNLRNKVAHTGSIPDKIDNKKTLPVQDYLKLVSDMLYFLDVLDGHEWAKPFARFGLQEALGWPALPGQFVLTIEEF